MSEKLTHRLQEAYAMADVKSFTNCCIKVNALERRLAISEANKKNCDILLEQTEQICKNLNEMNDEQGDRLRAASELVAEIPTLEQATTEMAKELGIKEEHLAPDGQSETKYYESIQTWRKKLEASLSASTQERKGE